MTDMRFEKLEDGLPDRHVLFYWQKLVQEGRGSGDFYMALEELIKAEFEVNDLAAEKRLNDSGFVEQIYGMKKAEGIDAATKDRLEREMYAVAPLLIMWADIRDVRENNDAIQWLEAAVELALVNRTANHPLSADHMPEEKAKIGLECRESPLCPQRTVAKALTWHAISTTKENDDGCGFKSPHELERLTWNELNIAQKNLTISPGLAFQLHGAYLQNGPSPTSIDEPKE